MQQFHIQHGFRTREFGLALMILLITGVVAWVDPTFLSVDNLRDILVRSAPTTIVACGVMLVVVTGEIDISVGSMIGVLAAVMGVLLSCEHYDFPLWVGVSATLIVGTGIGLLTGLLVTFGRVPSIIATLGLMGVLRGVTMLVMRGQNISGLPETLANSAKYGVFGIPLSLWVATLVVLLTTMIINQTPLGRQLFAVGSSGYSAKMLGLSERRLKLVAFASVGLLTAIATLVDVPRLPKIEAGIGVGFELLVVTCVVVGGVSISGGRGTVSGVVLAVILMTMVRPVLTFLDVGESGEKWTKAIHGGFIILAVVADSLRGRKKLGFKPSVRHEASHPEVTP